MRRASIVAIVFIFSSCNLKVEKDFSAAFDAYKYDTSVIKRIDLYDSLRSLIISEVSNIGFSDDTHTFTYYYSFDSTIHISNYSNSDLPERIFKRVKPIFDTLQQDRIFGFVISKDSVYEVLIRNRYLKDYHLDVRERLTWKPANQYFTHEGFPTKDTMLDTNWQYSVYFDKRAGF